MSKLVKFLYVFFIIFALVFSFYRVNASDINMNLVPNEIENQDIQNENLVEQPIGNESNVQTQGSTRKCDKSRWDFNISRS